MAVAVKTFPRIIPGQKVIASCGTPVGHIQCSLNRDIIVQVGGWEVTLPLCLCQILRDGTVELYIDKDELDFRLREQNPSLLVG
jgi:hypothetical protein